jgi:lactate dehydrogenase-like 2-hydroxyacid dehydrogenase
MEIRKLVVLDKNQFSEQQKREIKTLAKEVVFYEDLPKDDEEAIRRIDDADALIVCWYSLSQGCIDSCPSLRYLGVVATGYGWLAAEYAKKKGIVVTNVPGYATNAVATFILNKLGNFDLKNKTLGVIGLGKIGSRVAELAKSTGLDVIYWNRTPERTGFRGVGFGDVFRGADIIVLQVKSSAETRGIVKSKNLDDLKDGAIIVNVVSPKLFEDEDHLIALIGKKNLRLILDFEEKSGLEDIAKTNKNLLYSKGVAWQSPESVFNLHQIALENLKSYKEGKAQNRI